MHDGAPDYNPALHANYDPAAYPKYMMRYGYIPWSGQSHTGSEPLYIRADGPNHLVCVCVDGSIMWEETGDIYNFDTWQQFAAGVKPQVSPLYALARQITLSTGAK